MGKVQLTEELLRRYKTHPRILEIRLILLFDIFEKELGYSGARSLFSGICYGFKRNMDIINMVISRRYDIKRSSKTKKIAWRQEVMFMGLCYGESPYKIARNYLHMSPVNMYRENAYCNPDDYVTDEWLRNLDDEVFIVGGEMYRNEVSSFLDIMEGVDAALKNWQGKGKDV